MKQFKTLLIATALFIGSTGFMLAQSNIAHINTQELIQAMPEYKQARAEVEKLAKTYQADMESSVKEYEDKVKLYDSQAASQTDEENKKRIAEVQGMQQSIGQFRAQAQKDMQEKEANLLKPITEKAKAAIDKVAKAQGIQYVLDSSTLVVADGKDLLSDVKSELGI